MSVCEIKAEITKLTQNTKKKKMRQNNILNAFSKGENSAQKNLPSRVQILRMYDRNFIIIIYLRKNFCKLCCFVLCLLQIPCLRLFAFFLNIFTKPNSARRVINIFSSFFRILFYSLQIFFFLARFFTSGFCIFYLLP
jgi:hypothetical protein